MPEQTGGLWDMFKNVGNTANDFMYGNQQQSAIDMLKDPAFTAMNTDQQNQYMKAMNIDALGNNSGGFMKAAGDIGTLYGIYSGVQNQNQYMDLMNEQLGMAKEQWAMTKDELNRIKGVRNKLDYGYSNQGNYEGYQAPATQAPKTIG